MACQVQGKTINDVLELLVAGGFEGMAEAISILPRWGSIWCMDHWLCHHRHNTAPIAEPVAE